MFFICLPLFCLGCLAGEAKTGTSLELEDEGCIVLLYHKVVPESQIESSGSSWTVASEDFFKQINYLKEQGVQFITIQELERYVKGSGYFPGKYALVTFDDVDSSVYRYAFPILQQLQVPFALFVISGQVGNPNYKGLSMSTWDEIRVMIDSGLAAVGSNTHNLHLKNKTVMLLFLTLIISRYLPPICNFTGCH